MSLGAGFGALGAVFWGACSFPLWDAFLGSSCVGIAGWLEEAALLLGTRVVK